MMMNESLTTTHTETYSPPFWPAAGCGLSGAAPPCLFFVVLDSRQLDLAAFRPVFVGPPLRVLAFLEGARGALEDHLDVGSDCCGSPARRSRSGSSKERPVVILEPHRRRLWPLPVGFCSKREERRGLLDRDMGLSTQAKRALGCSPKAQPRPADWSRLLKKKKKNSRLPSAPTLRFKHLQIWAERELPQPTTMATRCPGACSSRWTPGPRRRR